MKLPLPPLNTGRVLADGVTASLREAILTGAMEPGEKVDQDLIARELGVSRTPIREALHRLEAEEFIENRPHYGAFVARPSRKDVENIYEVRAALEAQVVRKIAGTIPARVLEELEESLRAEDLRLQSGDVTHYFTSDICFHSTILGFGDNRLAREILDSFNNRIGWIRRMALQQPGEHVLRSQQEHWAILRALQRHNGDEAAHFMDEHIANSARRIEALVP